MMLDIISTICQVILAVAAIVALFQIIELRRTRTSTAERDAAKYSQQIVEQFLTANNDDDDELYLQSSELKVDFRKDSQRGLTLDELFASPEATKHANELDAMLLKHPRELLRPMLRIANRVEGMAVALIKGIGDEELAFAAIGPQFCRQVEKYYWLYKISQASSTEPLGYEYTRKLYKKWSTRKGIKDHTSKLDMLIANDEKTDSIIGSR